MYRYDYEVVYGEPRITKAPYIKKSYETYNSVYVTRSFYNYDIYDDDPLYVILETEDDNKAQSLFSAYFINKSDEALKALIINR